MRHVLALFLTAGLLASAGCDKARTLPGGGGPGTQTVPTGDPTGGSGGPIADITVQNCTSCHGTPGLDNAGADPLVAVAPPKALSGSSTDPAIGAHRAHLVDGTFSRAIECASCHLIPTSAPNHPKQTDGKVTFSRLATNAWSGSPKQPDWINGTCSGTYCHGNFTNGRGDPAKPPAGGLNAPSWTGGASQAQCGSCHAVSATNGPGGSHPTLAVGQNCGSCHGGSYTNASVDLSLHMNGKLDGGGHPPGWKEPDQHGLAALQGYFDPSSPCAVCHIGFGPVAGNPNSSCNGCHATPEAYGPYTTGTYPNHADWTTECTFCHGGRSNGTGAPPRNTHVISSDTTTPQPTTDATIGAHTSHVGAAHSIAAPLDCTACHATRWTSAFEAGHVDKTTADWSFANAIGPITNPPGSYTRPTCSATYCHGNFTGGAGPNNQISWTGTFGTTFTLNCSSCHNAPPGPTDNTIHHPPNGSCGSCHAGYGATTVNTTTHVNGVVEHAPTSGCTQCHGDITQAAVAPPPTSLLAAPASNANAIDAHGNPASSTSSRGIGAHAKHLTGTAWRSAAIPCSECHTVPGAGDVTHANGNPAVTFGALATTAWPNQPAINPVWNGANGGTTLTCSATYCHGNFKNGLANATTSTPTWAAPSTIVCGSCHGVSTTNGPGGTHPTIQSTQNCGSCHGGSYTNTAVDPSTHMNGALDIPNVTCSSCHGDTTRTPVASATLNDALGANLVKDAPPADAGGGAAATGAHLAHVNQGDTTGPPLSNALTCSICHQVPTTTSHSTGGQANVIFSGLAVTGGASPAPYDFGTHTCASTYCHGNFAGGAGANAIAWTGTTKLGCTSCHNAPPGPTSTTIHHPPNSSCASCHGGYTATTVNAATHVNGTIEHTPASGCTQCHGDITQASPVAPPPASILAAPASNANAVDAHGNAATSTASRGIGAHGKHLTGTTWRSAAIPCSECHTVPGATDVTHADGNPLVSFGALAKTAWSGTITPVWNGANGGTTLTCSATYCHGNFRNGANGTPTWATPSAIVCGSCHGDSGTNDPTPTTAAGGGTHPSVTSQNCGSCHGGSYNCVSGSACTSAGIDPALHMNGVLDGGGESTGGTNCGGCHTAIWNVVNGTTGGFVARHNLLSDVPNDDATAWNVATLSSVAASSRSCVNMCHGDHPHDLTSPAVSTHDYNLYADPTNQTTRGGTTRTSSTRAKIDFDPAANGGLCTKCHVNPVSAGRQAIDAAAFGASKHDFTTNAITTPVSTTFRWQYTLHDGGFTQRNCTKCHASRTEGTTPTTNASAVSAVHGTADPRLLAGGLQGSPEAGFVCYNCHGSASPVDGSQGNRSAMDVQTQIAKAQSHPVGSDTHHDTYAETTSTAFPNAAFNGANRHVNCMDCHDAHAAGGTLRNYAATATATRNQIPAGSPLLSATGIQYGTVAGGGKSYPALPASGQWPASTSANYGTSLVASATYEYEICFKCHTAYAFGGTSAVTTQNGPSGLAQTDLGMEFSPNMKSGHPVVASLSSYTGSATPKALTAAQLTATWAAVGTQTMTCTDCHYGDAASPAVQGPHGSAVTFLLRGPNTYWPTNASNALYNLGNNPNNNTFLSGLFCTNCHPLRTTSATNNTAAWSGNNVHYNHSGPQVSNVECIRCHILIPHGGKAGRLIGDRETMPTRYAYQGNLANMYVSSFTKAATPGGYNTNNCNASCAGTHSSTGQTDNW